MSANRGEGDGLTDEEMLNFDCNSEGPMQQSLGGLNNRPFTHAEHQQPQINQFANAPGTLNSSSLYASIGAIDNLSSTNHLPPNNCNTIHGMDNSPSNAPSSDCGVSTLSHERHGRELSLSEQISAQIREYDRLYQAKQLRSQSAESNVIPQTNQASGTDWISSLCNQFAADLDSDETCKAQAREYDSLHQAYVLNRQSLSNQDRSTHGISSQPIAPLNGAFEGMTGVTNIPSDIAMHSPTLHAREKVPEFVGLTFEAHIEQLDLGFDPKGQQSVMTDGKGQNNKQEGGMGYSFYPGKRCYVANHTPTSHNTKPVTCAFCNTSLFTAATATAFYCSSCGNTTG